MNSRQSLSLETLLQMKPAGEKITVLTAYDASMTKHLEVAGVEVILVGDSLGMVVQGHDSTLPVTVDDMIYHCRLVARAREHALLMVDMPYHSYSTVDMACVNAQRLMKAGADMV
ncbi:MAG: 3-methyl-2-oxobutanoate hydroxymethyltransferase, partial [Gammaproteobacteria bacterium]|nr:3-methyl-2-oxobutanoate hydroxymethyltransferase [Gammaproteobacteria bacterium]